MASILIVEDDKFLQDLYVELLSAEKYQVDVADDGEAALNKLNHNDYDLALDPNSTFGQSDDLEA